jgi:hypothetical protein
VAVLWTCIERETACAAVEFGIEDVGCNKKVPTG